MEPYYVGKPNPLMMRSALNAIQAHSETTAMIGDRMDTDIVAGLEAGLETILVLSGVTSPGEAERYSYLPSQDRGVGGGARRGIGGGACLRLMAAWRSSRARAAGSARPCARSLHDAGASVGLLSRRGEDLGLERGLGIACDVSDRAAVEEAAAQVVERFGALHIAVANAGVGSYGPFLELDPGRPRGHDRREPQGHAATRRPRPFPT